MSEDRATDFGYERVPWGEKAHRVRGVFDSVARNYDLMNDLMSGGAHRLWKRFTLMLTGLRPGQRALDVAGGTGDIAFRIVEASNRNARATVLDINASMLDVGRERAEKLKLDSNVDFVESNAEQLPFADESFDAYTIAFGIRNVTHIDKALAEARRVLKPGGRFLCLEFSKVVVPILDDLYDRYSFAMLPNRGEWVAKDAASYQYLAESIRKFPPQAKFARMIADAGLSNVKVRNLSGGIAAMHSAWRI